MSSFSPFYSLLLCFDGEKHFVDAKTSLKLFAEIPRRRSRNAGEKGTNNGINAAPRKRRYIFIKGAKKLFLFLSPVTRLPQKKKNEVLILCPTLNIDHNGRHNDIHWLRAPFVRRTNEFYYTFCFGFWFAFPRRVGECKVLGQSNPIYCFKWFLIEAWHSFVLMFSQDSKSFWDLRKIYVFQYCNIGAIKKWFVVFWFRE